MQKYLEILKKCRLFNGINETDLSRMLSCLGARVVTFDKKYTVLKEGNVAKYVGIVLSGSVQVSNVDYFGNRTIISNVSPSQMFCEAFACAGVEYLPVSVVATQESEVMFIDCEHILHTCQSNCGFHQQLIFNLMQDLAEKTIMLHQKTEITSKRTTREKLMAYLTYQSKKLGKKSFNIPFDRQELADFLQVERSGLSVQINALIKEGVITAHKRHFELL